jgi:hypothetical protein
VDQQLSICGKLLDNVGMTVIQYPDDDTKQARRNTVPSEEPEFRVEVVPEQEPDSWLETLLIIAGLDFLIGD